MRTFCRLFGSQLIRVAGAALLLGSAAFAAAPAASEPFDPSKVDVLSLKPTATSPVLIDKDDKEAHDAWGKAINQYMKTPAEQVTAHPAAEDFPGAVPDGTPTISRDITVPLNMPRWHSTGLYAAPGAKLKIHVSSQDATRGLAIVIGSQTDSLSNLGKWVRFPKISRRFEITNSDTVVANAFGGLVYIDVPRDPKLGGYLFKTYGGYGWLDETPSAVTGTARVRIDGGVMSPIYQAGITTPEQWKQQLETSKAPWAELAGDRMIVTVQTKHLDIVKDPEALLAYWGKVVDTEAELAGWPKQPAPPERIVVDRDISAGWMHSGYPIMAHLATEKALLDLDTLKTKGDWGYFHELGHNHEGQAFTAGGDFVEVDVNLFSMYVMQKLVGREMTAHPSLKDMPKLLEARLGPDKKADAWGNLAMYVETIQAFGWDKLHAAMASYAIPHGADGITSRQDKIDQWVLRYSKLVGRNLAAYYDLFDYRCSDGVRAQLADLPTWMPADCEKFAAAAKETDKTTTKVGT